MTRIENGNKIHINTGFKIIGQHMGEADCGILVNYIDR